MSSYAVRAQESLQEVALREILHRGAPILGTFEDCVTTGRFSDWMADIPSDTKLVHMNLPGTHDTCTWNYTPAVQKSLERYTGPIPDSTVYRCQQHSIFKMLNEGIRVFDLRYAWNPGQDTIGFYHSLALLSPTTRMEDVFFGLYTWLDRHPTEAVLVSMNYEPGSGTRDDARLQEHLYNILHGELAKRYWIQTRGMLGTLGEARGKLTLIQRFNFDKLPGHLTERIGIHLDQKQWTVNGKSIALTYNAEKGHTAYIQDHYRLPPSPDSENPQMCVDEKFGVIKAHLEKAIDQNLHPDQLYISFASAAFRFEEPTLTPRAYATGNGEDVPKGINHELLAWLQSNQGKRFGIILFDFYDAIPGLLEAVIDQKVLSKI
ncbi:PLC-like phosphodiesterase [Pholiota conissans]|uniref:PLC-like phosphodiesterase n=1 Tax=Pholiota conissans TaxID=109636 RepID=A0A9P6CVB6_9AGAR|nr:PLC-like phosphodiesterase [Pholiota conissans]